MLIKKQKCLRCNGIGCLECSWSGVIYKNMEFEDTKLNKKSKGEKNNEN